MLLPVRIEVGLPVLSCDALALERHRVFLDIWQELVQAAEHALEVQNEVRALLVRDSAVRVVGVLSRLEVDDETLISWPVFVLLERVLQCLVADYIGETAVGGGMKGLEEKAFDICRPAFVKPEVGRICLTTSMQQFKRMKVGDSTW